MSAQISHPRICILLVNWNGWRDTVECLESVFRSEYQNFYVVVCDNGSRDGSAAQIRSWAEGRVTCTPASDYDEIRNLVWPNVPKPISYQETYCNADKSIVKCEGQEAQLTLIHIGKNIGFGGANNVGIHYAMSRGFDYAWLLNNDVVVTRNALSELVRNVDPHASIGTYGVTLLEYWQPDLIQAAGGCRFNWWLAKGTRIAQGQLSTTPLDGMAISRCTDYVVGAAMFFPATSFKAVGLLSEDYFLYFEEIDWATRARKHGLAIRYSPTSRVFHKEGQSIGSAASSSVRRRLRSQYYFRRSQLLFSIRYFRPAVPIIIIGQLAAIARLALRGDLRAARVSYAGLLRAYTSLVRSRKPKLHQPWLRGSRDKSV